jgi:hypothetical protein
MKNKPHIHPDNLNGTFRTYTGVKFDLVTPLSSMINIHDIAISLAHNSHFNGHSRRFFSVAQHCVMVMEEYANDQPDSLPEMKLLALLHDASEAYTGDIIKPLKVLIPGFDPIQDRIMKAICVKFQIPFNYLCDIKPYDLKVQNIEYDAFYNEGPIEYWSCKEAYHRFMNAFNNINDFRCLKAPTTPSITFTGK